MPAPDDSFILVANQNGKKLAKIKSDYQQEQFSHNPAEDFDLKALEYGWPVGMPLCRSLGRGLWELRSHLPDGRIARVIFCLHRAELVLLHGFIKKTQKTPPQEIELAWRRMKGMRQ